jgi:excisionase family DNA binding protein
VTGLLTAAQAAERLGISVRTLDRYVEAGRITPRRTPGGHRRFDPADVDALLTDGATA